MSKLQGKIAMVTGASKGIGSGIARELAAAGAAIVVNYASDRIGAESVVDTIVAAGGRYMIDAWTEKDDAVGRRSSDGGRGENKG